MGGSWGSLEEPSDPASLTPSIGETEEPSRLPESELSAQQACQEIPETTLSVRRVVFSTNEPTSDPVLWVKVTVWVQPCGQLASSRVEDSFEGQQGRLVVSYALCSWRSARCILTTLSFKKYIYLRNTFSFLLTECFIIF